MTPACAIPRIDFRHLRDDGPNEAELQRMRNGLEASGAFLLRNHGVSSKVIDDAYTATRALHALELDRKRRFAVGTNAFARGWYQGSRAGKGTYETFEIGLEATPRSGGDTTGVLHGPNVWPDVPHFKESAYAYFEALRILALRLVPVIAGACGLPTDYLVSRAEEPCCLLRLLHYDAPEVVDDVGITPHTDFELFTILSEDAPGLAVCGRDGTWQSVSTHATAEFVVMAGDLLEIVTGGHIESPLHRVVTRQERRSLAFFLGLDASATVAPQLTPEPGRERLYRETSVGAHLAAMYVLSYPHIRTRYDAGAISGIVVRASNPFKQYKLDRLASKGQPGDA